MRCACATDIAPGWYACAATSDGPPSRSAVTKTSRGVTSPGWPDSCDHASTAARALDRSSPLGSTWGGGAWRGGAATAAAERRVGRAGGWGTGLAVSAPRHGPPAARQPLSSLQTQGAHLLAVDPPQRVRAAVVRRHALDHARAHAERRRGVLLGGGEVLQWVERVVGADLGGGGGEGGEAEEVEGLKGEGGRARARRAAAAADLLAARQQARPSPSPSLHAGAAPRALPTMSGSAGSSPVGIHWGRRRRGGSGPSQHICLSPSVQSEARLSGLLTRSARAHPPATAPGRPAAAAAAAAPPT
jgi:hypothetical protein